MLDDEFLEDESAQKEKKSKKTVSKKKARPARGPAPRAPRQVTLGWTTAFVVVGFLVGFLLGGVMAQPPLGFEGAPSGVPGGGGAPVLSPEELEGGDLPSGHPQLPSEETATTVTDGEGTATTVVGGEDTATTIADNEETATTIASDEETEAREVP